MNDIKKIGIILVLVCVVLISLGQIFMKFGMNQIGSISIKDFFDNVFNISFNKFVFFGVFFYALSAALWLIVLSKLELSYVHPLISLGYVVTAISALIFLNEHLTFMRILGTVIITAGSFFVAKS